MLTEPSRPSIMIIRSGFPVFGSIGSEILKSPYPPILSRIKSTLPAVGASEYASGSQEWKGKVGSFARNPKRIARNIPSFIRPGSKNWNCAISSLMSNVATPV